MSSKSWKKNKNKTYRRNNHYFPQFQAVTSNSLEKQAPIQNITTNKSLGKEIIERTE